jgi:two-component system KDP operon response regulator KdpE
VVLSRCPFTFFLWFTYPYLRKIDVGAAYINGTSMAAMTLYGDSCPARDREAGSMREGERPGTSAVAPIVLVIEDDRRMRKFLRAALGDQGFRVVEAESGQEGLAQAVAHNPDLVLLDVGLPDLDGLQVTMRLREWTGVPILILSAREDEEGKVLALDSGANDYLTKPFGTSELMARIRVWLRQTQRATPTSLESTIEVGDLRIDLARRIVLVAGEEVRVTATEYKLFALLIRNAGKVLTHEQILTAVWGPAYTKEIQYLRVYIGQLRQKLEKEPARPRYLVTEPGVGYRLRAQ